MTDEIVMSHPAGEYEKGCRCEPCVLLHNERVRRNRAERLASGRLTHGTRSAYDAGCRCEDCLAARRRAVHVDRATRRLRKGGAA